MNIEMFIPIADAPLWVLIYIRIFGGVQVHVQESGKAKHRIQYYEVFGKKYWTRKWVEARDNASMADAQLGKRKINQK